MLQRERLQTPYSCFATVPTWVWHVECIAAPSSDLSYQALYIHSPGAATAWFVVSRKATLLCTLDLHLLHSATTRARSIYPHEKWKLMCVLVSLMRCDQSTANTNAAFRTVQSPLSHLVTHKLRAEYDGSLQVNAGTYVFHHAASKSTFAHCLSGLTPKHDT
jgi:hypothetical protein